MDYNAYLLKEYKTLGESPKTYNLEGNDLVIPASYKNTEDFLEDLLAFQDREADKYARYNNRNPDKQIYAKELKVNKDIWFIVPLRMAKQNLSDEEVKNKLIKKALKRYKDAIEKTARFNKENPQKPILVSLSEDHFSYCHKEHAKFVTKKIATKIGKALKWSAKQTADVAIGLAGSPVLGAYKLLDKKYHWEENKFSHFLDKQIAPKIKKALLTTAITSATLGGIKGNESIKDYMEKIKIEKAEKERAKAEKEAEKELEKKLNKKYKITDEQSFDELYKASFEHIVKSLILSEVFCPKAYSDNGNTVNTIGLGSYYYPKDGNPESSNWVLVSSYLKTNGPIEVDGAKAVALFHGWLFHRDGGRVYKNMRKNLMGAELNIGEFSSIVTCYYNSENSGRNYAKFVCKNYDDPYACASKLMSLTPQNEFKAGIDKRHLHEALKYLNYDGYNKKLDDLIVEKRFRNDGSEFYATSITQLNNTDCLRFKNALKEENKGVVSAISDKVCSYEGKGNGETVEDIYNRNNMGEAVSAITESTITFNQAQNIMNKKQKSR